jgi:hypothetical protein
VRDFFVNEREFIIYHEHRQKTVVEDLLMEAPDEEVRVPTQPEVGEIEYHVQQNNLTNLNHVNMRYHSMNAHCRSGLSSLFLNAGAGLKTRGRAIE